MSKSVDQLNIYYAFYDDIRSKMVHQKYYYTDTLSYLSILFEKNGLKKQNQIYWKEILLRSHYASTISLLRNEKWLKGIILSIEESNYILFSSSLRGFLESVTDSYYSLLNTPFDLANNFYNIKLAVEGNLETPFSFQRLEESLIHFQFAKRAKKNDGNLDYHKALSTTKYIDFFDKHSDKKVKNLYKSLCEVVHPTSESVEYFTRNVRVDETSEYTITDLTLDDFRINEMVDNYKKEIEQLLKISISAPFICLKVLGLFDLDFVKSTYINTCTFNKKIKHEVWSNILEMVEQSYKLNDNNFFKK